MTFFRFKEINFLLPVFIMQFFANAKFYIPIWILFFQSRGLNFTEIGFVISGVYLSSMVFEYPTGIFADKYGRKLSLLMFLFLSMISFLIELNAYSITGFFIASILFGCALSFSSGAFEAMIYDALKNKKLEKKNSVVLGLFDSISSIGAIISPLIGSILFSINGVLPYWAAIISYSLAFISLLFFKEPEYKKGERINAFQNFKEGIKLTLRNPVLKSLLLLYIPLFFFEESWYTTEQPYLIQLGLPIVLLGAYESLRMIFFAFGGIFLPKLLDKFNHKKLLFGIVILEGIVWFTLGSNNLYTVIIFSYILILLHQLWNYVDADIIHEHIHSQVRATTLSARQMIINLLFVFNPWLMGYLVNSIDRTILYPVFGLIIFVVASTAFFFRRKNF